MDVIQSPFQGVHDVGSFSFVEGVKRQGRHRSTSLNPRKAGRDDCHELATQGETGDRQRLIELIRGVVSSLASGSFRLKGRAVFRTSVLLSLTRASKGTGGLAFVAGSRVDVHGATGVFRGICICSGRCENGQVPGTRGYASWPAQLQGTIRDCLTAV